LNTITDKEKKQLEQIAQVGFAYAEMLSAIPVHLSTRYNAYYLHKGARNRTKFWAQSFSSISLAIAKGYSAEQRAKYLAEKAARK